MFSKSSVQVHGKNKLGLNWAKLSSNWNFTLIKVCYLTLMITYYHYIS